MSGTDSPSEDSTKDDSPQSHASVGGGRKIAIAVACLIVVAMIIGWFGFSGNGGVDLPGDAAISRARADLETTQAALAATENLETDRAEPLWSSLFQADPKDSSVALNRALNRVLSVDAGYATATNPSLDADAQRAARSKLPAAIALAREAVEDMASASDDVVTPLWLRTRVDLREAALLPGSMTKSRRREVFERLREAIEGDAGKDARSVILGGLLVEVLTQMEDPIDGLPAAIRNSAAETLQQLSDRHPSNLFFALRSARLNIEAKNIQAARFAKRSGDLARAVQPMVARETRAIGLTPAELVSQIIELTQAGEFSQAETRMLQWFNVLNGTEIVKTDRRLASPHPLDRLSFDSSRRLAATISKVDPVARGVLAPDWKTTQLVAPEQGFSDAVAVHAADIDLDLDVDMLAIDRSGKLAAYRNDGGANFQPIGVLDLGMQPTGMVSADLFMVDASDPNRLREKSGGAAGRHDTLVGLIVFGDAGVRLVSVDGRVEGAAGVFALVEGETGLEPVRGVTHAIAGDLEADGDLDLILATARDGVRLFANRGNRTFFEVPSPLGPAASPSPGTNTAGTNTTGTNTTGTNTKTESDNVTSIAIGDLDRDLDLDLVTTHASGRVGLIENLLHLQFRHRYLDGIEPIDGAAWIAIEDVDGNVSWDILVSGTQTAAIVFSQTADAGAWSIDRVEDSAVATDQPTACVVADLDNDSWLDWMVGPGIAPIGPWGIGETSSIGVLTDHREPADLNADGLIDIVGIKDGVVAVAVNQTPSPGHHLDLRFKGIDDNATGRVNHYAIGSVLEARFGPHYRARIVTSPTTHFGIDGFKEGSIVRAILPNGLTQTIRDVAADTLVEEEQTLKGSCPYLYAWDGTKFRFVTDCLWAAPLGLQVADGIVAKDRPWEYLKIDGRQIRPRDGQYDFRLTEELWEIAYFDKVALTAVDHPADVEIWTNEKVGPENIATPTIFAFGQSDRRPVAGAVDTGGNDVTERLVSVDRDFVKGFDRRLRQGLCTPHWVDLDFGPLGPAAMDASQDSKPSIYLLMTGWILPTDTSLNIQIDQNPDLDAIEFPSVWVPDGDEGWTQAIAYAGFPGGKTKTIVIDVTEAIRHDDPRLRVRTSAQIYWDAAELVIQKQAAPFRTTELALLSAEVTQHGFSRRIKQSPLGPETYDYQDAQSTPRWPPLRGNLSRLGDCLGQLGGWDDDMVVIGAGDEIRLRFEAPSDPPDGWVRDFVMHNVGWDKDADLNTLAGQTVGPLPFREMTAYPPPIWDPQTAGRESLNRPHLTRQQSFREFWHRAKN